ncbi:hypothetical protein [Heyndrickxia camelliae]|uniref:Uncharacterized protein n=1 Tax=Heyndrickxia camelliae TaxID=1707093 RepID=A0A2N3LDY0_9BACI|nr:hypothetical protein [Heyndrickxia camelliae]PKR82852.1 hypothetical protein CWO92_21925 [Heyndrickxia camelliae]
MTEYKVRIVKQDGSLEFESLYSYCSRLSKKNNSVLYRLESYLHKKLLDEPELAEIRDILLTVSADITKLHSYLHVEVGDDSEKLQ